MRNKQHNGGGFDSVNRGGRAELSGGPGNGCPDECGYGQDFDVGLGYHCDTGHGEGEGMGDGHGHDNGYGWGDGFDPGCGDEDGRGV